MSPQLTVGDVVAGRYRVQAAGVIHDLGTEYPVHDQAGGRHAVLLLDGAFGKSQGTVDRLIQARQELIALGLPALPPLEEIVSHLNGLVLVRKHVPGESLVELLSAGPLTWRRAVEIALALCDTLAPAHEQGLVHGSLSPYGVWLEKEQITQTDADYSDLLNTVGHLAEPWVVKQVTLTETGLLPALPAGVKVRGRPPRRLAYCPPEQLQGRDLLPAADVYAIGALLYEMLTGRLPYLTDEGGVLASGRLPGDPPALRVLTPDCPWQLSRIVHQALSREVVLRPHDAGELARTLRTRLDLDYTPAVRPHDLGKEGPAYDDARGIEMEVLLLDEAFGNSQETVGRLTKAQQELIALGRPALPPVEEIVPLAKRLALVRRHVPGGTLTELLSDGPLTWQQAVEITLALCDALAPAHERGLVHGGLSPSNVWLQVGGQIAQSDRDFATLVAALIGRHELRWAELVVVTEAGLLPALPPVSHVGDQPLRRLGYCPLEQLEGQNIRPTADVYAMGVLLYEMLAGELPYLAGEAGVLATGRSPRDPPALQAAAPDSPYSLAQIVHRALSRKAAERYRDAGELADALRTQLGLSHTPVVEPSRPDHDLGTEYQIRGRYRSTETMILVLDSAFGSDWETVRRLSAARQALVELNQPTLPAVEGIVVLQKRLILVYRHPTGRPLTELMSAGPLTWQRAVEITLALCDALVPAHERGLVHGGLSPLCVWLQEDGGIAVTETGLLPPLLLAPTAKNLLVQRLDYCPPEQVRGQRLRPSADVYAIGALLYEMLTGQPLPWAGTAGVSPPRRSGSVASNLRAAVPDCQAALARIVDQALSYEPTRRYRNARQLAHVLRAQVGPRAAPTVASQPRGANLVLVGLLIVALVAVLGLVLLWQLVFQRYALPAPSAGMTPERLGVLLTVLGRPI